MPENVGVLEIRIENTSDNSTVSLEKLREKIAELKAETQGGIRGLQTSAKHLDAFSESLNKINFEALERLHEVLSGLDKLKSLSINVKGLDKVNSETMKKVENPIGDTQDLSGVTPVDMGEMSGAEAAIESSANAMGRLTEEFIESADNADILRLKIEAVEEKLNSALNADIQDKGKIANLTSQLKGYEAQLNKVANSTKSMDSESKKVSGSITSIGKASHKSSGLLKKLGRAVGRIVLYRAIRSAIMAVTKSLKEGIDNLYQWSKLQKNAEGNAFAKSLDKIASSGQYLKNSIAAMIEPLVNTFAPKLELIINKVVDVINEVNKAIAVLSGQSTWKKAKYMTIEYAKAEDKAADSAKELKKSLLGIDELNVLDNNASKATANSDIKKYEDMFETVKIDKGTQEFQKYFDDLALGLSLVGMALLVAGAVIAFTGANIPLGIGMMIAGGADLYKAATMGDGLSDTMKEKIAAISKIIADASFVIGAILAFTGANIPVGIGLMASGVALSAFSATMSDKLSDELKTKLAKIEAIVAASLTAIGVILLFADAPLGLGLLISGLGLGASALYTLDSAPIISILSDAWDDVKAFAADIPNGVKVFFHNLKAEIGNQVIDIINLIASPFTGDSFLIPDNVGYTMFDYDKDYEEQLKNNKDFTLGDYINKKTVEFTVSAIFSLNEAKSTAIDFITNTWNKLSDKAKEFKAILSEKSSAAKTFIVDKWNKLSDKAKSFTATLNEKKSTAKAFITDKWNKLADKTKTFTAKATDKDGKLASLKKTIDSIFGKDKKTISITATLKDSFTQTLYGIVYKLFESINNLISAINSRFKTSISLIKNPVKKVPGDSKNSTKFAWQGFASGGHPDTADVFYANENGIPEMVGRIGNQPTVATNADIVAAVSKGVASAVSSTMNGANGDVNVNVYLDGEKVYQNVVTHNKQNTIRTGKNALAMA